MFVFDSAVRLEETRIRRKKTDLADIQPKKSVKERIRGEKMSNIRVQKVRNFVAATTIAATSIFLSKPAIGTTLTREMHKMDSSYAKTSELMRIPVKASMLTMKPAIGKDTVDIVMGEKGYIYDASKVLAELGLDKFPENTRWIKIGGEANDQSVILTPNGLIQLSELKEKNGGIEVKRGSVKTDETLDMNAPQLDSNGIFIILNRGSKGTELVVVDQEKGNGEPFSFNLTKYFKSIKNEDIRVYVDISKPANRAIFITKKDGTDEKLICGVDIDRNKILLAER